MKNIAIILAGGSGKRMGSELPKQFLPLDGKEIIEHSVDAFENAPSIDEIAIVTHSDYRDHIERLVGQRGWSKVAHIINGGAERYLSSLNAVSSYIDEPDDTNLILHDAARPWISQTIITRVTNALKHHEAVGVAVASTDTIWEVMPDFGVFEQEGSHSFEGGIPRIVQRIPERSRMYRAQTPQAFRLPLIRDAYQRALQDPNFRATDDCGVVRQYMPGTKIFVVEGEESNRKITFAEDLKKS